MRSIRGGIEGARRDRAVQSAGRASSTRLATAAPSRNSSSAPRSPRRCRRAKPRLPLASANTRSMPRRSRMDRLNSGFCISTRTSSRTSSCCASPIAWRRRRVCFSGHTYDNQAVRHCIGGHRLSGPCRQSTAPCRLGRYSGPAHARSERLHEETCPWSARSVPEPGYAVACRDHGRRRGRRRCHRPYRLRPSWAGSHAGRRHARV